MGTKDEIKFHFLTTDFTFSKRKQVKYFLMDLFNTEGKLIEAINYIFCSDDYLFTINKKYLNHNTYTDIVTFELSEPNSPLLADIFISIDRIKANAIALNIPFSIELLRIVIHGSLHLCSYKDKTSFQKKKMTFKEDEYLSLFVSRETKL